MRHAIEQVALRRERKPRERYVNPQGAEPGVPGAAFFFGGGQADAISFQRRSHWNAEFARECSTPSADPGPITIGFP